jgi:hypothetical protein
MFQPHYRQSLSNEFIEKSVIQVKIYRRNADFFYSVLLPVFACQGKGGADQGAETPIPVKL